MTGREKAFREQALFLFLSAYALISTGANAGNVMSGHIKPEHFKEAGKRALETFHAHDADSNGIVTHEELMRFSALKFNKFDVNRDGLIALSELPKRMPLSKHQKERLERFARYRPERNPENNKEQNGETGLSESDGRFQSTRLKFVARLDRDNDEQLSLEEFLSRFIRHFKRNDIDGNGEVTLSEVQEAFKKRSNRHRKRDRNFR